MERSSKHEVSPFREKAVDALWNILFRGRRSTRPEMRDWVDAIVESVHDMLLLQPDPLAEAKERARWRRHAALGALQGLLAGWDPTTSHPAPNRLIAHAVLIADALLVELEKS